VHPFPLRLWGWPSRAGIYDDGAFGCFGSGGLLGLLPEHVCYGSAPSRELWVNCFGKPIR